MKMKSKTVILISLFFFIAAGLVIFYWSNKNSSTKESFKKKKKKKKEEKPVNTSTEDEFEFPNQDEAPSGTELDTKYGLDSEGYIILEGTRVDNDYQYNFNVENEYEHTITHRSDSEIIHMVI
jgi:hypothetical protein